VRAVVSSFNSALNNYNARTANDIALSFSVLDGKHLVLNESIEVDLNNVVSLQQVTRASNGECLAIKIGVHDLHDLRLTMQHGVPRTPSKDRLADEG
jgi:hypothetical protein